ncbi:amidoligase, partial [Candidatus Saccharibacteria bacterium]|nr:amidoligase [Candidatus Saccharibacteria bacterium]NIV71490.1 amidoligase [Calditrichia bacterium]NIW78342.1 amidoligase [Calditrichia bacterium]
IEAPALDVQTLSNYLRAYLLLHHWIVKESDIDFTRRIAPFIDEFPEDYMRLILDSSYNPSRDELITDYHEHNPTRNRPLDMLPIFTHVNRQLIGDFSDELVKPRPTFHYRLPNCLIDDPNWTVAREWDYWVAVEKLANEPDKIAQMSKQYFEITNSFSFSVKDKWYNEVIKWM